MFERIVSSPESPLSVVVDWSSGLPKELRLAVGEHVVSGAVRAQLSATLGGTEARGWTGGIRYDDSVSEESVMLTSTRPSRTHRGTCDEYAFDATLGPLFLRLRYRLYPTAPYLELVCDFGAPHEVVVRNVRFTLEVDGDPHGQVLHAPGNAVHRGVTVEELGVEPFGISPIGGLRGASGLIAVTSNGSTLTVWPNDPAEIPDIVATRSAHGLRLVIDTNFAAALDEATRAELLLATLDLQPGGLDDLKNQWPDWAARYSLTSPASKPAWVPSASIYEVQIGTSYFWGGNNYCRYDEIADVVADLGRIRDLGFSVIQLMPLQPYPSYNVHDYADVSASYGDEAQLRELVTQAHTLGMRVILDVLLHGVLDNESIDVAVEGVLTGPLAGRLEEELGDSLSADLADPVGYNIAWSRHILDFAQHWKSGAPPRSPLQDQHPDWFYRDSGGSVTGIYTKAFDARNPGWQRYFRESMTELLDRLDIDGFRFDAPTYNAFPNWADWARARAGNSPLGCVPLFVDLRRDIKERKPDALMYTEPSGHLLRRSMDLNYNYDEQWLVTALATPGEVSARGVTSGLEFMQWMQDRDAFLPSGSQTAHHIDSHDTFWWPQWGKKWRREQFGIEKTRALSCVFLALDGPFMMFTGGEEGLEDELHLMNSLRRDRHSLWDRPGAFDTNADASGDLVIILRRTSDQELAVVVNVTGDDARTLPSSYLTVDWSILGSHGLKEESLTANGYVVLIRSLVREGAASSEAPDGERSVGR